MDMSRIVEIRDNSIWQDESVESMRKNDKVGLGLKLKMINYEGYMFVNRASRYRSSKF